MTMKTAPTKTEPHSTYEVTAEVWRYAGEAGWHFITLPADIADEVQARCAGAHRPFGSLPIRATIGSTTWATSLFKDKKSGSYVLPVNADVRRQERIDDGQTASVRFALEVGR